MGDAFEEIAAYLRQSARVRTIVNDVAEIERGLAGDKDNATLCGQLEAEVFELRDEMNQLATLCQVATKAVSEQDS